MTKSLTLELICLTINDSSLERIIYYFRIIILPFIDVSLLYSW